MPFVALVRGTLCRDPDRKKPLGDRGAFDQQELDEIVLSAAPANEEHPRQKRWTDQEGCHRFRNNRERGDVICTRVVCEIGGVLRDTAGREGG